MPEDPGRCECWLAPSTKGVANPSAWLAMHDSVEIHTSDSLCMRGRPGGLQPVAVSEATGMSMSMRWSVEDHTGSSVNAQPDDVVAIDPIPSDVTQAGMVNDLLRALGCPSEVPADGLDFKFLVGSHESLQVSLRLKRWPCQPLHEPPVEQSPQKLPGMTVWM